MPAPSSTVLTATRAGTVSRHILFYLNHPLGVVRAWDGIGNLVYGGNTYLGVGGLARVRGVSDSTEIQDHDVAVEVSGVNYSALTVDDGDIRGVDATLRVVLLDEAGAVVATRLIFSGVGRRMRIIPTDNQLTLVLELRGLMHDWGAAPRVYYSDVDQQRLFASDTGFSLMASLQDATITGWSLGPESSGGYASMRFANTPLAQASASPTRTHIAVFDRGIFRAIGNHNQGLNLCRSLSATTPILDHAGNEYKTYEYGDPVYYAGDGSKYLLSTSSSIETPLYIDTAGIVRSASGRLIVTSNSSSQYLRRAGTISSNGTSTAETVTFAVPTGSGGGVIARKTSGSLSVSSADWTALVFDNGDGRPVIGGGGGVTSDYRDVVSTADNKTYVEDVTGTAALVPGTTLQVGGVNCTISTTGVVLSSGGRRIKPSGADSNTYFLRVWT